MAYPIRDEAGGVARHSDSLSACLGEALCALEYLWRRLKRRDELDKLHDWNLHRTEISEGNVYETSANAQG